MSGQSFTELLNWHPRDVATLVEHFDQMAEAKAEADAEERFAAARRELHGR